MKLGKRIMIMGSSGSGKSTLARQLGEFTGLPVVHMDLIYWKPGWVETPKDEVCAAARAAADRPAWIIDGNNSSTMDYRVERADTVIYLDFSRYVCIWRVLKRWVRHYGKTRPDMRAGCIEKIDLEFLHWIWNYPRTHREKIMGRLADIRPPKQLYILKGIQAVRAFEKAVRTEPASVQKERGVCYEAEK